MRLLLLLLLLLLRLLLLHVHLRAAPLPRSGRVPVMDSLFSPPGARAAGPRARPLRRTHPHRLASSLKSVEPSWPTPGLLSSRVLVLIAR